MRTTQQLPRTVLLLILALLLFAGGCSLVQSESDVPGDYELKAGNGKIELKISPDKTFSETIFWPNGKIEKRSGKWLWSEAGIGIEQLWIPREFAPDYILEADASAKENHQPKYTEPGYWAMRPEKHWRTVILPIFPDADMNFRMVRRFRQPSSSN